MLHDVWQIIEVPIEGRTVSGALPSSDLYVRLENILQCTREKLFQHNTPIWKDGGVGIQEIFDICKLPRRPVELKIRALDNI